MDEETDSSKVVVLIEKATHSTAPEVDPRLLKAIKLTVRYSDSELRVAAQTLMSLMKRDHSQVRYLTLLIIDELFMRSKLFRTLVAENLDQLLSLAVGFRINNPLPPPTSVATVLRSKAIEFLEKWNEAYGIHYRQLRLGYEYLKNALGFQFPNLRANAERIQLERRERQARTQEILLKKFESLKINLPSIKEEVKSTVDEIEECLEIVRPDEDIPLSPVDDEGFEEFRNSELRQIRLDSLREGDKVKESAENKVVLDAVREFYKVLTSKHLPTTQEWISVLIRVDVPESDTKFRDNTLKELIDLRNLIQSAKIKCEESGFSLSRTAESEEEENIWEEGTAEKIESGESAPSSSKIHDKPSTSTDNRVRKTELPNANKGKNVPGSSMRKVDPLRGKLLAEAPMVRWGNYLDNWGSKRDALANHRGLELDNHWGRVDYDATVPAEKIAELNVHASIYEEEPVETQPCRAPLRKGGLCQRRDLRVCPFHGPIIPRDEEGKPTRSEEVEEETTPQIHSGEFTSSADLDTADLTEKLLRQAVKNVRDRDREAVRKKRELDQRAMKKAKLGKVREHNEAVLRDAAIASTSRSAFIGEGVESSNRSRFSGRGKKLTLASMLKEKKNKETVKGRLAQRLLNGRTRDARQIAEADYSKYREAFPNQW